MISKRIICFFLSAILTFPPNVWPSEIKLAAFLQEGPAPKSSPAGAPEQSSSYADYQSILDEAGSLLTGIQSHLNKSIFDFEALLDSLDYDHERIVKFSKQMIAFQQYPGVLRGPKGTLLSRAGNSIDQALLLAKLLRDAGYDARIAGTRLTAEQGKLVLKAMQQPVQPPPAIGDAAGFLNVLQEHGIISDVGPELTDAYEAYLGVPKSAEMLPAYESVSNTSENILKRLTDAGVSLGTNANSAELVTEARDYYWVQYKDGVANSWKDTHPVFSEASPLTELEAQNYVAEAAPAELLHKIRIQAFIERKSGGRLEVLPITGAWEAPVANLYGEVITFSIYTDSMMGSVVPTADLQSLLESANFFVPTFGNSVALEPQFFDLKGTLIDPFAASAPSAGIFAEINRSFGEAIGQIGDEAAIPTLTAQWLEITLTGPGDAEHKYVRTTFDRIGQAARKANAVPENLSSTTAENARPLLQEHTIMIGAGGIPLGFVLQSNAENFQRLRPGVETFLDTVYEKPTKQRSLADVPTGWKRHLILQSLFALADTLGSNHRIYRSGAAIAIHSFGLGRKGHLTERVDIVSNPRRAINLGGEIPTLDPTLMIQSGVWETAVEGLLLPSDDQYSTMSVFEAASRNATEPVVLVPNQPKQSIDLPEDTLAAIEMDLSRGYAVIAPKESPQPDRFGWWRVNLQTGETLGQIDDGRGASATEYILFSISLVGLVYGTLKCLEKEGGAHFGGDMREMSRQEYCCIGINALWTAASFALGLWITRVPPQFATAWQKAAYEAVGVTFSIGMDATGIYFPIDAACDAL